jgi:Domain of unknown function (DUF6457)
VTRDEWLAAFAEAAGVERPSVEEIRWLLDLAGTAAHASERTAAPIACFIAARSGRPLDELLRLAAEVAPSPDAA